MKGKMFLITLQIFNRAASYIVTHKAALLFLDTLREVCYTDRVGFFRMEGGEFMSYIVSLCISIVASVIGYYICKWIDRK